MECLRDPCEQSNEGSGNSPSKIPRRPRSNQSLPTNSNKKTQLRSSASRRSASGWVYGSWRLSSLKSTAAKAAAEKEKGGAAGHH